MKALLFLLAQVSVVASAATVVVYSDRPTARLAPHAQEFEAATGHQVVIVEAGAGDLLKRLALEGAGSLADLLILKDFVFLHDAAEAGLLQALGPAATGVEASMQNPEKGWTALTFRARTMVYNPQFVKASELSTYENLATPEWEGSLCVRTSKSSYNEGLVSFLVEKHGEAEARRITKGWVANLARPPFPNDTAIIEAVSRGECLVGLVNTYYVGQAKSQNPNLQVEVFFADQASGGVHTNGSGVGLLKTADDAAAARTFIAHLLSPSAQQRLADAGFEYPAVRSVVPGTLIRDFGSFTAAPFNWATLGLHVIKSRQIMTEAGF